LPASVRSHVPAVPYKKLGAKLLFQLVNIVAHCGLGKSYAPGRLRKIQRLRRCNKILSWFISISATTPLILYQFFYYVNNYFDNSAHKQAPDISLTMLSYSI
jgi:hypothetical protein